MHRHVGARRAENLKDVNRYSPDTILTIHDPGLLLFDVAEVFVLVGLAGALKGGVTRPSP